jgi:hypothetical protein
VVHAVVTIDSCKHQARPPTDHFEKLLEETCPNHAYLVQHKLRDCGMIKNFMVLGSLTQGMEVDEVPDEGDMTLFLGEDVVMTIHDERPSLGMRRVSNPSLVTQVVVAGGCRNVAT